MAFLTIVIVGGILVDQFGGAKAIALDSVAVGSTESEVLKVAGKPNKESVNESRAGRQTEWTYETLTLEGVRHHEFEFEDGRVVDIFKR